METPQRNKLSMYLAVLGVMERFEAAWTALPGIVVLVERLRALTEGIQSGAGIQGTPREGVSKGKNRKQVAMINLAAEVAGDLHSWAVAQQDDVLTAQADVEVSGLVNTADTLVAGRCREIHRLGVAHAAGIAGLGTTAADLAELDQAIKDYEPLATAPRAATVAAKGVTGDIATDTRAADRLLKAQLDKAMRKFKRKNADFATAYANARVIVNLGGGGGGSPTPTPPPGPVPPA